MALDDTSIVQEINAITNQGPLPVHFQWYAEIALPDNKGKITSQRVLGLDNFRDYQNNYCDEIMVEVALGHGDLQQLIIPNATNLTITLTRVPIGETSAGSDLSQDITAQPYTAKLVTQTSSTVGGSTTYGTSLQEGNMLGFTAVKFQLVDKAIEQARMQSFGGNYHQDTLTNIMTSAMLTASKGLKVDDAHQIKGVDMVPANNTEVYPVVPIEHGTRVPDIPRYIAGKIGMPYGAGFGAYLQKNLWFIYPLYDLTLFDKSMKTTLTVINVPKNRLTEAQRTFRTTGKQVIVLSTEQSRHVDVSEAMQLTLGNGARYADATQMFHNFATVKNNVATASRQKNINEYVVQPRPDSLNNVQMAPHAITANTFKNLSALAPRLGSLVSTSWANSDPGLLYPGMPVQYIYEVDTHLFALKGQLVTAQHRTEPLQSGLINGPYRTFTILTLFVEKELNWDQTPDATAAAQSAAGAPTLPAS